jgi:very-short-patch-repair endonuclease
VEFAGGGGRRVSEGETCRQWRLYGDMRQKRANRDPDRLISRIASRQRGVITLDQLLAAGLSPDAIKRRVAAGRLHRIHRGVYAVGHRRLTREGIWLAAVLAAGPGAALSHQSAGQHSRLLPLTANPRPVHVTVPGAGGRRRREGIVIHRSTTITQADIHLRDRIPTTKPARTLSDLRPALPRDQWEDAVDRARFLHLPIGDIDRTAPTKSRLERAMLRLCRRHRLPLPEVNVWVGAYEVDFLWRSNRLIVETDGWETHRDRASFEADRARDAELKLLGYEVVRFTYRQVLEQPERVARTLRALLSRQQRQLALGAQPQQAPSW